MALRAVLDGINVEAFDYSKGDWVKFKKLYKRHSLKVACCGRDAVPKTSKLGTQYFAHAKRGDCSTALETSDHIKLKSIVAQVAVSLGWDVVTECSGHTPKGQKWIADVMCIKGNAKVAIEIQWSEQTLEEFLRRTKKYTESGIRCAWLFRLKGNRRYSESDFVDRYDLPYFGFRVEESEYKVCRFGVSVQQFVRGMLNGKLVCAPAKKDKISYRFHYSSESCWRCDKKVNSISKVTVLTSSGYQVYSIQLEKSHAAEWLATNLPEVEIMKYKIGPILSKVCPYTQSYRYFNSCVHCRAEIGGINVNNYIRDYEDFDVHFFELPETKFKAQLKIEPVWLFEGSSGNSLY
jgi:competence protein CoiA|tara:strand:+ start:70201 stop:71247 length:1047 start_codon:yes stop_codon:yes gene_type:complete